VAAALQDIKMAIQSTRALQQQEAAQKGTRIPNNPIAEVAASATGGRRASQTFIPEPARAANLPQQVVPPDDPWVLRQAATPTPPLPVNVADLAESAQKTTTSPKRREEAAEDEDGEEDEEEEDDEDDEEDDEDDEEEGDEDESEEDEEDLEQPIEERVPTPKNLKEDEELDTDQETDRLLGQQYNDDNGYYDAKVRVKGKLLFVAIWRVDST